STPATITCDGTVVWTYRYTACDGTTTADWTYTYTVIVPDFPAIPGTSATVSCVSEIILPTLPVVNDACGNVLVPVGPVISPDPPCNGTKTYTWTYTDCAGHTHDYVHTVTVNDIILPVISCPGDQTLPSDWNQTYATVSLIAPTYSDNCTAAANISITWTMSGATTQPTTSGIIPSPYQFNSGSTVVTYTAEDACGNKASCSFTITVFAKPEIDCPLAITQNSDPNLCTAKLNPGVPTLISGTQPITWTWIIDGPSTPNEATGTFVGSVGNPGPPSIGLYDFKVGTSTIRWNASNASGDDNCTQTVTVVDNEAPTFSSQSISECVDKLYSVIYTETNPNPNSGVNPNLIKNPSPDYYTFIAGNTSLDLTGITDNCCAPASLIIHWRIDFTNVPDPLNPSGPTINHPSITGTGQPSTFGSDILMWGDGVNYTTVSHNITFWVEDCNGNTSATQTKTITVNPRPRIIKMN
ncbi:MAG: HYR domain-containing protein, partial [Prolixibacteraceae bacterium]|nr:HYR domain-containing protein [Prolixibacteraceae bacterium]